MSGVRKSFRKQLSLSSGALDLIMKFWSEGTAKQYAPHLRRWFSFCFNPDVTSGAKFLTQHFRKFSYEYSSVNTAHSAFSSVFLGVNVFTSGEQTVIKSSSEESSRKDQISHVTLLHVMSCMFYPKVCWYVISKRLYFQWKVIRINFINFHNHDVSCKWTKITDFSLFIHNRIYLNNSGGVF